MEDNTGAPLRDLSQEPFVAESVFALRKIRERVSTREYPGVLTTYVTLCEVCNNYHSNKIVTYIQSISTLAKVSEKSCLKYLNILEDLELIHFPPQERSSDGKYAKREIGLLSSLNYREKEVPTVEAVISGELSNVGLDVSESNQNKSDSIENGEQNPEQEKIQEEEIPTVSEVLPSVSYEKVMRKLRESYDTQLSDIKKHLLETSTRNILKNEHTSLSESELDVHVLAVLKLINPRFKALTGKGRQNENQYLKVEDYDRAIADRHLHHQIGSKLNVNLEVVVYFLKSIRGYVNNTRPRYKTFEDTIEAWIQKRRSEGKNIAREVGIPDHLFTYEAQLESERRKKEEAQIKAKQEQDRQQAQQKSPEQQKAEFIEQIKEGVRKGQKFWIDTALKQKMDISDILPANLRDEYAYAIKPTTEKNAGVQKLGDLLR